MLNPYPQRLKRVTMMLAAQMETVTRAVSLTLSSLMSLDSTGTKEEVALNLI